MAGSGFFTGISSATSRPFPPGAPLRPERGDDVGRSRSPVGAGEHRLLDPADVHQGDGVDRQNRLPLRKVSSERKRVVL
jgi:hypothetical protein